MWQGHGKTLPRPLLRLEAWIMTRDINQIEQLSGRIDFLHTPMRTLNGILPRVRLQARRGRPGEGDGLPAWSLWVNGPPGHMPIGRLRRAIIGLGLAEMFRPQSTPSGVSV